MNTECTTLQENVDVVAEWTILYYYAFPGTNTLLAIQKTELSTSMLFLWKNVFLSSKANDSEVIIQSTAHLFQVEDC